MLKIQVQITFDDLPKLIEQLTDEQKKVLRERLKAEMKPRIPDLFPGMWTNDDFDAPLSITPDYPRR